MAFNPDDFAPKKTGFNPDDFLPSEKSGFNPNDFLPKEEAKFNPDGFLPVTQNDFKAALGTIRDAVIGAVKEQARAILPPASTPSPLVYEPGADPFKGMKELGQAAQIKGAGLEISPEQQKALEDFTVENFKGIVLYPAAIAGASQAVGWYIANKTLPGSIRAAREAVTNALKRNGVPEAEASRMADEGMTQAVAKAQAAGAEPGVSEFVALRKAAEKGIKPKPAPEPTAGSARPVEEPLFPAEAKTPEAPKAPAKAAAAIREIEKAEYGTSQIPDFASTTPAPEGPEQIDLFTEAPAAPAPDWKYVDAVQDPFRKYSWLEKIANSSGKEVTDTTLSGVLDRLEQIESKVGSNAWNVAWAVSQNPAASPATKTRALSLREEWMKPGRFNGTETYAERTETQLEAVSSAYKNGISAARSGKPSVFDDSKFQKALAAYDVLRNYQNDPGKAFVYLSRKTGESPNVVSSKYSTSSEDKTMVGGAETRVNFDALKNDVNKYAEDDLFAWSATEAPNAERTGAQVEGGGQEVAPAEKQGAGIHLRDVAENRVEAPEGEIRPKTISISESEPPQTWGDDYNLALDRGMNAESAREFADKISAQRSASGPVSAPPAEPPAPPVENLAAMSDEDWVAKLKKDLANAKPEVALQNIMYSEERAKRFAQATQNYTLAGGGVEGFKSALGAMKGALEKRAFEALAKTMPPEGVDRLSRMIASSPNLKTWGDRLSAFDGLSRIMEGKLPQQAQIAKLQLVFGKELADEILKKRSTFRKAYDIGLQVVNVPRSLMASMDLNAPFRQGIFFVRRPQFWGQAWVDMIKSLKSEADFEALQQAIENDPDYAMLKDKGLGITGMSTVMGEREEDFAAPIVERALKVFGYNVNLPGRLIRASGRAYVGFLNKLRLDVAKSLLKSAEQSGFKPTEDLVEKIVRYVNDGTGRGGLGVFQGAAVPLNATFFSPRLIASRINLMTKILQPSFYEKNNAFVRQQYWRDLLGFMAFGSTFLGIAKMAGADVGLDPRSSDFGKVKIGKMRIDPWGGFQQYARMLGQLISGEYVSSITGKVMTTGEGYKPLTRRDIIQRQVESKLSPTASFINTLLKEQDWEGQPVSVKKELANRVKPLAISDLVTTAINNPELLPLSSLGIVGFGVQTYGESAPVDYSKMATSMSFSDIAKTLEITEDPKARTQLFQAGIKKFPAAIRKAEDKEEVKRIRARMVQEYHRKR